MSGSGAEPDPRRLYDELRMAAPDPPLSPLRLPELIRSDRGGPVGSLVTGIRRLLLRIIAPSLVELVNQLERERHRQHAINLELEARIARLGGTTPAGPVSR